MDSLFQNTTVKFVVMDVGKMSLRDQRQAEFADEWLKRRFGILHLCPRFGKIYTTINIMEKLNPTKVLIAYPDVKIRHSWETDFEKRGYDYSGVTFTTHMSLKKHVNEQFDLVVFDEIHLLSEAQITAAIKIMEHNRNILGLTGTMARWTKKVLYEDMRLREVVRYPIEQAIEEGVLPDYQIDVIRVPLNNTILRDYNGKSKTEKAKFDAISWVINKQVEEGKDTRFMRLTRMRIVQNSLSKLHKTKQLLKELENERVLVFCGVTAVADKLGIPVYHSKSGEKKVFDDFASGKGNHLAVIKIGNTGVTYKPLNKVIISSFDSNSENLAQRINRCMSMEYDNPGKKAHIYIICSTEEVEAKWLDKALEFFDKSKVKYL